MNGTSCPKRRSRYRIRIPQDGPHNQIESKPAIEAEVMKSEHQRVRLGSQKGFSFPVGDKIAESPLGGKAAARWEGLTDVLHEVRESLICVAAVASDHHHG